jgi:hypothetical protein
LRGGSHTLDERHGITPYVHVEQIDQRFAGVDTRFAGVDERLDRMSSQLSTLIIGVAIAAISGILGMITAMLR